MPFAPVSFCRPHVSAVPALMAPDAELCKRCLYRWTRHASSQLHHGTAAGSSQLHHGTVAGSFQLHHGTAAASSQLHHGALAGSSQLHHGTAAGSFQLHHGTVAGSAQLSQVDLTAWQGQACQRGADQRQSAQADCSLRRSLLPAGTGAAGLARAGVQAGRR